MYSVQVYNVQCTLYSVLDNRWYSTWQAVHIRTFVYNIDRENFTRRQHNKLIHENKQHLKNKIGAASPLKINISDIDMLTYIYDVQCSSYTEITYIISHISHHIISYHIYLSIFMIKLSDILYIVRIYIILIELQLMHSLKKAIFCKKILLRKNEYFCCCKYAFYFIFILYLFVLHFLNILTGKHKYFCLSRKILAISRIFILQIKCYNILLYIYIINNLLMFHQNIFIICVLISKFSIIFIY